LIWQAVIRLHWRPPIGHWFALFLHSVPELVGNQDEQTDVLTGIPAESEEVRAVAAPWEDEQ
jgi:hypothetical protein